MAVKGSGKKVGGGGGPLIQGLAWNGSITIYNVLLGLDEDNLQGQDLSNIPVVEKGVNKKAGGGKGAGRNQAMEIEGTGVGDEGRQLASLSLGDTAKTVANLLWPGTWPS